MSFGPSIFFTGCLVYNIKLEGKGDPCTAGTFNNVKRKNSLYFCIHRDLSLWG